MAKLSRVPERSFGEGSGNVLVQGENLGVLKALLPEYRGGVDVIFIDPPYNARAERWTFPDPVLDWQGTAVGARGEDPLRHDKWLSMMYPRLTIMREVLSAAGSLWMTLDDNSVHHASLLMDEVFGGESFIACITWERGVREGAYGISEAHNYVLAYARDVTCWGAAEGFSTIWPAAEAGTTDRAVEELRAVVEADVDYLPAPPKPLQLLRRIVRIGSRPDSVVLDCFAGSGATGQAVLEQNAADGGERRYVLVESDEAAAELASERLRRVPGSLLDFYSAR